ncbi:MAG: hypothetical protein A2494_01480 [Candidatus Lloydbacteria bacterium RIFOXYC12_FULL_46_25]|uniref:Arginase n=1 Tax=Candidatus Lloydbacteria bacterium RIFOXYC12_FULL_46_25 TaxID=1798670 RepID=A0A1G2E0P4_9BACT|nr:MAG: hypothetical protein A2494_01480 [Candidatus Lloydbacteria bacterium RIFOXYC12_FULL_46_25]
MHSQVDLIGVPFDLGGGCSGARDGPRAFVDLGLLQDLAHASMISRYYDLREQGGMREIFNGTSTPSGRVHFQYEVAQVAKLVSVRTFDTLRLGRIPVVLGGDHSISIGSIGAALHAAALLEKRLGVVWIDAHLDAHTHLTTHSHRAHGLPLATLLGHGPEEFVECARMGINGKRIGSYCEASLSLSPSHVIHLGRGEDHCESEEYAFFEKLCIPEFSRKHLHEEGWSGLYASLRDLCARVDLLWVSLDLDSLDHSIAPGVYYPNPNGLLREEVLSLASTLAASGKLCGVDLMEYNPQFEKRNDDGRALTAGVASDFLLCLLGA